MQVTISISLSAEISSQISLKGAEISQRSSLKGHHDGSSVLSHKIHHFSPNLLYVLIVSGHCWCQKGTALGFRCPANAPVQLLISTNTHVMVDNGYSQRYWCPVCYHCEYLIKRWLPKGRGHYCWHFHKCRTLPKSPFLWNSSLQLLLIFITIFLR